MRLLSSLLCCISDKHTNVYRDAETNGMTGGGADASTSKSKAQPKSTSNANAAQNPEPYTPARSLSLFQSYVDEDDSDVIGPEGLEKLCNDAQISVEGALPMILAWQFQTSEMMKIKKDEWIKGTEGLRICSLPVLQIALTDLDELLIQNKSPKAAKSNAKEKDREKDLYDKTSYRTYASNPQVAFQKLYTFCFNLVKPEQSRNIDMETASALWSVLLVPKYPVMTEVIEFIEAKPSYKAVNKDLWSMMLEFCETVKPDLSNYEADGAWPTLLDDFAATKRDASAPSATATSE
ncbi:hypothetical protein VKT23_013098 [Stygiomarasmius scandens]|uniref:Defective in cullin neddylation protein n=1 Tax=Marasmiellus scandens TaxID=2682957 RepID=A0ABR1J887_9AGAR